MVSDKCPKCGKPRYRSEAFCFECNYIWPVPLPVQKSEQIAYAIPSHCPICNNEGILKVSGVVASASASIESTSILGPTFVAGSELVTRLLPPKLSPLPKPKDVIVEKSQPPIVHMGCALMIIGILAAVLIAEPGLNIAIGAALMCVGLVIFGKFSKSRRLTTEEEMNQRNEIQSVDNQNQERTFAWDRSFYCPKCDTVFDAGTGRSAQSVNAQSIWS